MIAVVVEDFTMLNAGAGVAVTVAVDGGDAIGAPVGGVPLATAESLMVPLSRSAWVTG